MYELEVISILYAQGINLFESLFWTGSLWKLKPPFFKNPNADEKSWYHVILTLLYVAPFLVLLLNGIIVKFLYCSILVWLLNDLCWHFWSVSPKFWITWLKYYFNPFDNSVLWYVRYGIMNIPVTPKRMFLITVFRVFILCILYPLG